MLLWRYGVRKSKLLDDFTYDKEIERLSALPKFPQMPAAQKELRRALRRISETDIDFLHRLISDVIDQAFTCPTPADLIRIAGEKRARVQTAVGNADCEICHGSGFVTTERQVNIRGVEPYEAEFAALCACRGGK
jgi:hypothetical protein